MPAGFKIADGYVEVHGKLDEPSFKRAAKDVGERAGRDTSRHFETAFGRAARRSAGGNMFSRVIRRLFTPDPALFQTLARPFAAAFSIPIVAAIGATLAANLVTAVAAAVQSAVLLGIGGLAVGGAAALLADKLHAPFERALAHVGKVLKEAAAPLVGPLRRAIRDIAHEFDILAPQFERIFKAAAPIVPLLVDTFAAFAEAILPAIAKMMPAVVAAFEVLADRAPELADAVADLLLAMAKPETIEAFGYLLTGLVASIRVVSAALGFLTRMFNSSIRKAKEAAGVIREATGIIAGAIGRIPLRRITRYLFQPFAAIGLIGRVTGLTKRIPKSWKTAYHFLAGGAVGAIRGIIGWIRRIPKNVTTTITTVTRNIVESIKSWIPNPWARASGGIIGAQGLQTGGISGRRTVLVGEHGPELAELPFGSRVVPAGQTRAALAGGGGDHRVVLEFHGGSRFDDLMVEVLRRSVRARGGNVQVVLGR